MLLGVSLMSYLLLETQLNNSPRFVILIHGENSEQVIVCTELPNKVGEHQVPAEAAKILREKGHWFHPSASFTIRMEGIWEYIDRYTVVMKVGSSVIVSVVNGFPTRVMQTNIPGHLKNEVDTKGIVESLDGNIGILKEGVWADVE